MSRRLDVPYTGPGYNCERCDTHVQRRKRYDRRNYCTECAVEVVDTQCRFVAEHGRAVYRAAYQAMRGGNGPA